MKKNKLIWSFIGFAAVIGIIFSAMAFSQTDKEQMKMEDLEKQLVLGEGNLPQEITQDNTKIFAKNGINDVFAIQMVEGVINVPLKGTVLTDEVCEPDIYGYYHCWNNIELSNGEIIRGLTIHDMNGGVPCLSPDSEVVVTPYKDGYFLLKR
ncbi:hypothetical protein P5F77_03975 [Caldifermentibacillus hisashii]|uniref:hypothetical protein n=1 Tax=Caldifermentibacillus hisashii TaxID=996558 RepID=UPI0030D64058